MSSRRVLLIEDSPELVKLWTKLFSSDGFEVTSYMTGRSALEAVEAGESPDVIITDYYLPDINGLTVLEEIRTRLSDVPVIMVTGSRDNSVKEKIENLPRTTFLQKPLRFDHLEEATLKMLSPSA